MSDIDSENGAIKRVPKKGDKVEVVRILILAVVSFVLGFGLVVFFLGPRDAMAPEDLPDLSGDKAGVEASVAVDETDAPSAAEPAAPAGNGYAPASGDNPLLSPTADDDAAGENASAAGENVSAAGENASANENAANEATAPPEVPPGRTPDNVALDGSAFYLKCWDGEGNETQGTSCDKLSVFEKRVATRLYVVDSCKQKHSGAKASGKMSLGIEVDFDKSSLSFWNGASSTLENAPKIATCLRTALNGLPIQGVSHKYSRYRMFYTVLFGDEKQASSEKVPTEKAAAASDADASKNLPKGKSVTVTMDQVRVRKSPVDGEVLGKIAKGNEVKLLKKKGDWCQILTPNGNEGWIICEALSK